MNHPHLQTELSKLDWQQFSALLTKEVHRAKQEIYTLDSSTPVEPLRHPSIDLFAKRDDASLIHSYKWRGAYFKMLTLVTQGNDGPFVAASAGNHAQGVASSARELQRRATIFMPQTTPTLKVNAAKRLGGEWVEIVLVGDQFSEAAAAAEEFVREQSATMIPPYDDLQIIAGQATVGVELFEQIPDLDVVFVPIGGGGLASGLSFAMKEILKADVKVIGVEVENQNAMQVSTAKNERTLLEDVDRFCDGTAVKIPGHLTYRICKQLLDEIVLVSNSQVSRAAQFAWEAGRFVPEPSGAIALAGALIHGVDDAAKTAVVVSGSNTDFRTLSRFVRLSGLADQKRHYYRFEISEQNGALIGLLDRFLNGMNIVDFQYGKSELENAFPVLGVESTDEEFAAFEKGLAESGIGWLKLDSSQFTEFRVIPLRPELCADALFLRVEMPNRPGSLRELMRQISGFASLCYFNFRDSGESEGRALIGFEGCQGPLQQQLLDELKQLGFGWKQVDMMLNRIE